METTDKKNRWKHALVKRLVAYLLLPTVALVTMSLTGCLESMVFYYPSPDTPPPPVGVEEISIEGPGGSRLHGWFLRAEGVAKGETAPAVLHVHGNAGNIGDHFETCEWLPRIGVHVLMFDYRGYGKSDDGRLLRANLIADANAALDYLLTREDVDTERIGLFGWSLGGVIGLAVASEREEVDAVLAVASFSSWKRVAGDYAPIIGQLLIPGGFNAEDSVTKLGDRSLLLLHGTDDGIVRAYHSDRLRDAATGAGVEVELVTLDGYSHNDWMTSPEAVEAIRGFFRRELVARED